MLLERTPEIFCCDVRFLFLFFQRTLQSHFLIAFHWIELYNANDVEIQYFPSTYPLVKLINFVATSKHWKFHFYFVFIFAMKVVSFLFLSLFVLLFTWHWIFYIWQICRSDQTKIKVNNYNVDDDNQQNEWHFSCNLRLL